MINRSNEIFTEILAIGARLEQRGQGSGVTHADMYFAILGMLSRFKDSLGEIETELLETPHHIHMDTENRLNSIDTHIADMEIRFNSKIADLTVNADRLEHLLRESNQKFERLEEYTRMLEHKVNTIVTHFVGEAASHLAVAPPSPIFITANPEADNSHWAREYMREPVRPDNHDDHLDAHRYFMNAGGRGNSRYSRFIRGQWPERDDTPRNPEDHPELTEARNAIGVAAGLTAGIINVEEE